MTALRALPRRVLMTADAVGGVWHYALELARGLTGSDVEVVLAVLGPPPAPEQELAAAAIDGLTLVHGGFALEWMPGAERDLDAPARGSSSWRSAFAPDLIHLNGFAHATLPWRAPTVVVAHSCVLSWWRAVHGVDAPAEWAELPPADACGTARGRPRGGADAAHSWSSCRRSMAPCDARCRSGTAARRSSRPATRQGAADLRGRAGLGQRQEPASARGDSAPARLAARHRRRRRAAARRWRGRAMARAAVRRLRCGAGTPGHRRSSCRRATSRSGSRRSRRPWRGCALVLGDIPTLRELWDGAALFVPPDDPEELVSALQRARRGPGVARAARRSGEVARRGLLRGADDRRISGRLCRPARRTAAAPPWRLPADGGGVRFVLFYHSLVSDWNHGNAHFLRGVVRELQSRGHEVLVYEPRDGWSRQNLVAEQGARSIAEFAAAFPDLRSLEYDLETLDLDALLDGADVVIVHEWNPPELVERIGRHRARGRRRTACCSTTPTTARFRRRSDIRPAPPRRLRRDPGVRRGDPAALPAARLGAPRLDVARGRRRAAVPADRGRRARRRSRLGRQLGRRRAHRRAPDLPARAGAAPSAHGPGLRGPLSRARPARARRRRRRLWRLAAEPSGARGICPLTR